MGKILDLKGKTFNRLAVISYAYSKNNRSYWNCICKCVSRTKCVVQGKLLRNNDTGSCGCLRRELPNRTTHGKTKTSIYHIWISMKARCNNKMYIDYKNYGGRGISVCDRWLHSFENFYEDMGPKPTNKHTIDRINNNGNYEPRNCRWITRLDQANNKRSNIIITYKNKTQSLAHWCRELGLKYSTTYVKLLKQKSVKEAFKKS